ncbi:MAG: hypothetical protein ACLGSH_01725 [Acidobacteriota bacterium]
MSDTAPRNPMFGSRLLADALLRTVGGASAQLRVTMSNPDALMNEVGLLATTFAQVVLSPVVMRRVRPRWQEGGQNQWEMFVSATSVEQQVSALDLQSAQALFGMTLAVTVAGQDYLIEAIAANEVFGQVYMYRLLLREAEQQAV